MTVVEEGLYSTIHSSFFSHWFDTVVSSKYMTEFILLWLLHINVLQYKDNCFNVAYMLIIATPPPSSLFPSISSPPVVHESSNGAGKGSELWPGWTFVQPHCTSLVPRLISSFRVRERAWVRGYHCTGTSDVHHYTVNGVMYRAAVSPGWLWWSEILISSVSVQQCCKEHRIHDLYLSSLVCNHQEIKVTVMHNEVGELTWNFVLALNWTAVYCHSTVVL